MQSIVRFIVHDIEDFPIVWTRRSEIKPGYAVQWEHEMDALMTCTDPFVIIFEEGQPEEAHEDRKTRGLWLKRNKLLLAEQCKAVLAIEPDSIKRAALKLQSALVAKAFGVTMDIAASAEDARSMAYGLLGASPR
ncbi:MAG: hypothetical protein AB1704_11265 [Pseudomonadota bacterium]|jgi:hypothetical protein|uniref:hypothetical protein n=1 Tax=Burkholderiaceae TaxID=119060 RepID=UPI0010F9B0B2|nr:hypothetical protein [Burkholderia sp. 4M9327F10]